MIPLGWFLLVVGGCVFGEYITNIFGQKCNINKVTGPLATRVNLLLFLGSCAEVFRAFCLLAQFKRCRHNAIVSTSAIYIVHPRNNS